MRGSDGGRPGILYLLLEYRRGKCRVTSCFPEAVEQSARPHHEDKQHYAIDQRLRPYRRNPEACKALYLRQQQGRDDGPYDAAHTSDNNNRECHDQKVMAHRWEYRVNRAEQYTGQPGKAATINEGEPIHRPDRDAE